MNFGDFRVLDELCLSAALRSWGKSPGRCKGLLVSEASVQRAEPGTGGAPRHAQIYLQALCGYAAQEPPPAPA